MCSLNPQRGYEISNDHQERLEAMARKRYLSRAALLTVWVREALEREAGG